MMGPSLLLLSILGTVCPNMSVSYVCFPKSPLQALFPRTFTATFVLPAALRSDSGHFWTLECFLLYYYYDFFLPVVNIILREFKRLNEKEENYKYNLQSVLSTAENCHAKGQH